VKSRDYFLTTDREKTMIMTMITQEVHVRRMDMLVGFRWSKNDVISIAFVIYEWCPMCITRCIGCVVNIVHKGISVNNHSDSVSHVAN